MLTSVLSHPASSRLYFVQVGAVSGAEVVSGLSWNYAVASAMRMSTGTRSRTACAKRTRSATRSKAARGMPSRWWLEEGKCGLH